MNKHTSLSPLDIALQQDYTQLKAKHRLKPPEQVITRYFPPSKSQGSRYQLQGHTTPFMRLNSNGYLNLAHHPEVIAAAETTTQQLGVGPGAVRFINGTFKPHIDLEKRIAQFINKPAAIIFNSAYTANLALALSISTHTTYWIGDELNHNSIIRAMRIANVPKQNKTIYRHNDMTALEQCLSQVPDHIDRVCIICDGIFSMRGDHAPLQTINQLAHHYANRFKDGVTTIVDDSHGIGAYGHNGRGSISNHPPHIIVGTFGKALGVNGGFIAGSSPLINTIRQKADTYIYTNPLNMADCSATIKAIDIIDSNEGQQLLSTLQERSQQFRTGINQLGLESIESTHPIIPILYQDTHKVQHVVTNLFQHQILTTGITFPIVPKGSDLIRFQINTGLAPNDISYVLDRLKAL